MATFVSLGTNPFNGCGLGRAVFRAMTSRPVSNYGQYSSSVVHSSRAVLSFFASTPSSFTLNIYELCSYL
ncbi:hypothetical protein VTI28DRAFT_770 [Corynascus sepedonium]